MNSKYILLLIALFKAISSYCQISNNSFAYQAIVRDSENTILASAFLDFKFTIRDMSPQQEIIYAENHYTQSDSNGLIKLHIGEGTPIDGVFSDIDWNDSYTLDVEMDSGNGFILLGTENLTSVPYAQMARQNWSLFGNDNANTSDHFIGTNTSHPLQLRTNNIPRFHITPSGKCGIGTTTPIYDLEIRGPINVASLGLNGVNGTYETGTILQYFAGQTELWNQGDYGIKLIVNGAPGLTIDNDQRVGIGTWGPQSGLHVDTGADLSLGNPNSGFILMGNTNDGNMVLDQNEIMARNGGQTATLFLNTQGGAVVINQNSTPGFSFAVNGTCAKPGGGSWSALSDSRLKDNVKPFNTGLSTILKVNPVTFSYNEKSGYNTTEVYTGVIAQDLKIVAPEMVTERSITYEDGSTETYFTVDPSAFTYMLINAVQEQQKKIEELEFKVNELETMQKELDNIKALLSGKVTPPPIN